MEAYKAKNHAGGSNTHIVRAVGIVEVDYLVWMSTAVVVDSQEQRCAHSAAKRVVRAALLSTGRIIDKSRTADSSFTNYNLRAQISG